MPGLFDLIQGAMGRPDPSMQLRAALNPLAGVPSAGAPTGPAGPPGASGGPAAPTGSTPGIRVVTPPDGPPGGQQPQQAPQPMAYQTPQDLGSMFVQLMQRQQANEGFNRSLGMLAAGFAQPRDRAMMIDAMSGQSGDPASLMGNVMKLTQYNQQQQRLADMQKNLPALAQSMNIPLETLTTMFNSNPEGFGQEIAKIQEAQMGLTGDPGERAVQAARADWHRQNPGKTDADMLGAHPELADAISLTAFRTGAATTAATEAKDRQTQMDAAKTDFVDIDAQHKKVEDLLTKLKANPDAVVKAVQNLGPTSGWGGAIRGNLPASFGGLDQATRDAAGQLVLLHNILYSEGWKGKGTRLSQTEAARIGSSFDNLSNPALSADEIKNQLGDLTNQEATARVNAAAAAGQTVPQSKWNLVNKIYKDKGDLFTGAKPVDDDSGPTPANGSTDLRNSKDPDADYAKLPKGAEFIGPDGKRYRK
jgi:hypothetical protein